MPLKTKKEVINGKHPKQIITIHDERGRILNKIISPLMVEFRIKDVLQVIIGASILAIPVGYTEETWYLGELLPLSNIMGFLFLSLLFIASFVYYNYYRNKMKEHWDEFIKRVFLTYVLSFIIVAVLLTLIQKTPWTTNWILAFKRIVIVAFPSSMSGTIADMIK